MKKLAKKLHGLLENIDIPNASVPNFDKLEDMLEYQYGIEMDAIELYSKLADMAEQEKNTPFMEFFAGLAKEEEDDREAIAKRLGRVPSKYSKVSISIGDKP
jgi:rubrerythrin